MLSRFSSLFVYVVAGLAISAAATPMSPPREYDDGSRSPSYSGSSYPPPRPPPKYPHNEPMKSYSEEKEKEKYPEEKEKYSEKEKYPEKKYPQAYDRDMSPRRKYNEKHRPYSSNKAVSYNQQSCNVGNQHCCNQVIQVGHYPISISAVSLLTRCC